MAVRTGEVHRRGCIWRAGARHKRLSYVGFFSLFSCRNKKRTKIKLPEDQQEILDTYISLCEELEFRRTTLAFLSKNG